MPDGYELNPSTLEQAASALRTAGTTLDGLGGDPGTPDAGELSGDMAGLLARFLRGASELVIGVNAAGDQVAHARNVYLEQERSAHADLSS
ncbi:hypothetical protein SAMN05421810_106250 [Amycolatopsis arida]|uniref:Uncharacterized protein n=1 Tax=Amycolatopsis arida TaxID=587909 RepID=A0A1I5XTT2_9PSEU|nr:hypothetical protein [Amycolatopsis arida]TDX97269.1 hypothetical protein CLV69_102372 [Amycolatopsis arida]SFQ35372.1 hypothetical protein SAMN05421810_106250 [Amycolatopsis arida]